MKPFRWTIFLFLVASAKLAAQNIVIEGVVTDWNNSPLSGVTIQISRDGRGSGSWAYVGDTTTNRTGGYRFEIPKGDPLVVYYSRSAYHPSEVRRLSGARNAVIGVALRSSSDRLSKNEIQEQLLTIEGMIAMSKVAPPEKAQKIHDDVLARLNNLDVPADLTKQVSEIRAAVDPKSHPDGTRIPDQAPPQDDTRTKVGLWEIGDDPPNFF